MAYDLLLATGLHFFCAVGLAGSLTSFDFFGGGFFGRLGNVPDSEGLAFLVKS